MSQISSTSSSTSDLAGLLAGFREAHPRRHLSVGRHEWEYLTGGKEGEALFLLPGAGGIAESGFRRVLRFEADYRVIAAGYPPSASTYAELIEGVARILQAEGVSRAHIHGHSLGGAVAQGYVRAHPEQVHSIVLANIGVPSAERMRLARLLMILLTLIPNRAVRGLFEARIRRSLASLEEEERLFYTHYLAELSSKYLTKAYLLNQLRCMQDFVDRYRLTPRDLHDWPGRILILESEDDTGFTAAERRALRELYPQAEVHTFAAAGHLAGAVRRDEYDDVLAAFLRGASARPDASHGAAQSKT